MDGNPRPATSRCTSPTIGHRGSLIARGVGVCCARDRSSLLSRALSREGVRPLARPELEAPERFVSTFRVLFRVEGC